MDKKEELVTRGDYINYDLAVSNLAGIVKQNDSLPRNNFMSRQDTIDVIDHLDGVLEHSHHFPYSSMYALIKLSADHHGIAFDIPAEYQDTLKKFKREVNYDPSANI